MADQRDDAFTAFVVDHGAALLRTAVLVTGDRHSGEDLVQTALAKAYGAWPRVAAAESPLAYVRRLMVNTHLSWLRRLTSTEQVWETLPEVGSDDDHPTRHADGDELRRALLQLSPRVRTAVVLRYFDDLGEAETAAAMGCSRSTVNNSVTRGLTRLRSLLAPTDDDTTTSRSRS